MTQQRRDEHSTQFGLWLRQQPEIDSSLGFVATNLDYVWRNYRTGEWMLIEEKRGGKPPDECQHKTFQFLHEVVRHDPQYRGFHILIFQHTGPEDGKMWWDGNEISKQQLIDLLRFKLVLEPKHIKYAERWIVESQIIAANERNRLCGVAR